MSARTFSGTRGQVAFEQSVSTEIFCGPLRSCVYDAELDTVFWTFPNDRKLKSLAQVASPSAELIRRVHPEWSHSELAAYAPQSRATLRCLDGAGNVLAYLKVGGNHDGGCAARKYSEIAHLAATQGIAPFTPALLAELPELDCFVLRSVRGICVAELRDEALLESLKQFGSALAALHNLPAMQGLPFFTRHNVDHIQAAARTIATMRFDLKRPAEAVASALGAVEAPARDVVCLHGDVHAKNAITHSSGLVLVDLDQAALGHPAADLGSFLASLRYERRKGMFSIHLERKLASRFLEGYAAVRPMPAVHDLRWHMAAALVVERALRSITRIRPSGLACLEALLEDARTVLTEGTYA